MPLIAEVAEELVVDGQLREAITLIINDDQFGGSKKSSACSALLSMIHSWSLATVGSSASI